MVRILGLLILALDIIFIIDALRSYMGIGKKLLWVVLILILPIFGVVYYFAIAEDDSKLLPRLYR